MVTDDFNPVQRLADMPPLPYRGAGADRVSQHRCVVPRLSPYGELAGDVLGVRGEARAKTQGTFCDCLRVAGG